MMRADKHARDALSDLTLFSSFYGTHPTHEETGAPAGRIADLIAPLAGPMVIAEKVDGVYFVPCVLKAAPLVGKTRERAERLGKALVGRMRSAVHVTSGAWGKLDGDGVTDEQLAAVTAKLDTEGIAYLVYSTHSHGRADKPGIRCRIIVFFDRALLPEEYERAALALSTWLLGQSIDPTEALLSQQAGIWTAHPDRLAQAFCVRKLDGYCVSADALLQAAPKGNAKPASDPVPRVIGPLPLDAARVGAALEWVDADEYKPWVDAAIWLRAAYGDEVFEIWLAWSQTAGDEHRATEEECERLWAGIAPRITAEQGSGALFAHARGGAVAVTRKAAESGHWDQRARAAMVYLRRFHPRLYGETFGVAA